MKTTSQFLRATFALLVLAFSVALSAHAQIETVLHSFGIGPSGWEPWGGLILDSAGNVYGTTSGGGAGWGNVFQLVPTSTGWKENVLYSFSQADGYRSAASLVFDSAGNLYGTNTAGGNVNDCFGYGCGSVFRLSPNASGTWDFTLLYAFTGGVDGGSPFSNLTLDSSGNLYGTTRDGGTYACKQFGNGCGIVFKLSPASTGAWNETVIHNFTGGWDGANPLSGLMIDSGKDLYGMTLEGGPIGTECPYGCGVIYKLSPTAKGGWTPTVLHTFTGGADGSYPQATLIADSAGNLYGTTSHGGNPNCEPYKVSGCGVVFQLSPASTGQWKETVLHAFLGGYTDGAAPFAALVMDSTGRLFGTTFNGGRACNGYGCGVVFEMSPQRGGGWTGSTLTTLTGGYEGAEPQSPLVLDSAGNLYGTTGVGGTGHLGTAFEITP